MPEWIPTSGDGAALPTEPAFVWVYDEQAARVGIGQWEGWWEVINGYGRMHDDCYVTHWQHMDPPEPPDHEDVERVVAAAYPALPEARPKQPAGRKKGRCRDRD